MPEPITPEQLHVLRHALGLDHTAHEPYRNRYMCGPDDPIVNSLVERGLMALRAGPNDWLPDHTFYVTEEGVAVAVADAHHEGADLDTTFCDAPMCPHCGHQHGDAWEWGDGIHDNGTAECEACEHLFRWERHIEVTYSTEKPETPEEATP